MSRPLAKVSRSSPISATSVNSWSWICEWSAHQHLPLPSDECPPDPLPVLGVDGDVLKVGPFEERRPMTASIMWNEVYTRPVIRLCWRRASAQVPLSLASWWQSSAWAGRSCPSATASSRIEASVVVLPAFQSRPFRSSPYSVKSASAN